MIAVDLKVIRAALCRCIDEYVASYSDSILLDEDLFWLVLDNQLFDMADMPKNLGVGSLVESHEDVIRKLETGDRLGAVEMQQLAAILNWLSAKAGAADTI